MTEQLYPNLQGQKDPAQLTLQSATDSQLNYMMDNQKRLQEKQTHYTKVKNNWSVANTVLKIIKDIINILKIYSYVCWGKIKGH